MHLHGNMWGVTKVDILHPSHPFLYFFGKTDNIIFSLAYI